MSDGFKNKFPMLQLKLSLLKDDIEELKEKIKEGWHIENAKLFDMLIRHLEFKINLIRDEVRKYELIKARLRPKLKN